MGKRPSEVDVRSSLENRLVRIVAAPQHRQRLNLKHGFHPQKGPLADRELGVRDGRGHRDRPHTSLQ